MKKTLLLSIALLSGTIAYGVCILPTVSSGEGLSCSGGESGSCQGCCSYTSFTSTCEWCDPLKPSLTKSCTTIPDGDYTVQQQSMVEGNCINGTCSGGLSSGNPSNKTCSCTEEIICSS